MNGFNIGDPRAVVEPYMRKNYKSVLYGDAHEFVNNLILSELDEGKYVEATYMPQCVHSIGRVPKKGGGYRPITDCKRPLGNSINNHMEETFQHFRYKSVDDVCNLMFPGCYLASVDVASAYRSISVHPNDWKYQGVRWVIDGSEKFLLDTRLCFGLRCAPYIFTSISDFIGRCMLRRGHYFIVNYIDDFCVGGATFEECQRAQLDLIDILGSLGFCVSWKKCTTPAHQMVYLGVKFDSVTMTIALPPEKLEMLSRELSFFGKRTRATKRQLRRLCGVLSHCSRVVRGGRTFSRRAIDMLKGMPEGNCRIKLTASFHEDLEWWSSFAALFNGVACVIHYNYGDGPIVFSDACLVGYGLVHEKDWVAGYFNSRDCPPDMGTVCDNHHHWLNIDIPPGHKNNINVLELVPILVAATRYGDYWANKHVVCFADNTQAVN